MWHGETDVADWTAMGGNRPVSVAEPRDYNSMFDNDFSTYWVGFLPVTTQNKVVVTFKKAVTFNSLRIISRPGDKQWFGGSYKSMCLVLDDNSINQICTAANYEVETQQLIILAPANPITATKVELIIQDGEIGQISDFKIDYQGTIK